MTETSKLKLPLVQPAQAQKHVTVNESFSRLDALVQASIVEAGVTTPPVSPDDGDLYGIGQGAIDAWAGRDGQMALFLNGGWAFLQPRPGWRSWLQSSGGSAIYDGQNWIEGAGAVSPNGAGFVHRTIEFDHAVSVGATSAIAAALPADAIVYGITGRVTETIGGAVSMEIGVAGSSNRYGSGIGTGQGAWARGITGTPLAYYAATDLLLTASGGSFDGTGIFRLAVHFAELTLPRE